MEIDQTASADKPPSDACHRHPPFPIIVSRFWRNRKHDAIVTTIKEYEGRVLVDVRTYCMNRGRLVPTPRGISLVILRLPDLAKAINRALKKARALGLLDDEVSK